MGWTEVWGPASAGIAPGPVQRTESYTAQKLFVDLLVLF